MQPSQSTTADTVATPHGTPSPPGAAQGCATVTGPGTVLSERYRLEAPIAAGGMSAVWRATDQRLGRAVAVKLMRDELLSDPAARERFEREARVAACLASPHIVDVYDVGLDHERRYLVMELIEGESLADRLGREGALDPAIAVAVADRVLAALEVAHGDGTVHRDVKPANVLLPADGGVKLADFGIAKALEAEAASLTAAGQVLGTPTYLSPEQVAGRPAGPASDVYAVGVMLHEMIAGRPPFDGSDPLSVALARQQQDPPRLDDACPEVDPAVADVVERALCRDPAARFADAGEMRAALASATPRVEQTDPSPVTVAPAGGSVEGGPGDHEDPTAVGAGGDDVTAVAAAPGGDDVTVTAVAAAPGGDDVTVTAVAAAPGGDDVTVAAAPGGDDVTVAAAPGGDDVTVAASPVPGPPAPQPAPDHEPTLAAPTPTPAPLDGAPGTATGRAAWLVGAGLVLLVLVGLALSGGGSLPTAEDLAAADTAAGEAPPAEDPVPPPATAGTVQELEALVRAHPDRWGPRAPELADRLAAVAGADGPEQGEHARALLAELDGWEAAGELDSELGARTRELVGPLAMTVEEAPPPGEGRGEGRGRGRGRGRNG